MIKPNIERWLIANDISLKKFIIYNNSVYDIEKKFKSLERKNKKSFTKAHTVAKTIYASKICGHPSINELNNVNKDKTKAFMIYEKGEYIPRTHGIRDCVRDTDYKQIEKINREIIQKAKENKIFKKNTIDGLSVMAWDGVELAETTKKIDGLPEREYEDLGEIRKYIKYTCGMNVGELANIMVITKQHLETEKVKSRSGKQRAKTIGETKAFEKLWKETEKTIGGVIDVHVFDALYLNQNITNLINKNNKYFVIRLKDESREIYQDAEGLFRNREADESYEIVEKITKKEIKYSKKAKKKNEIKRKTKLEKRKISNEKLGSEKIISQKVQNKKNSTVKVTEIEKVKIRKEVWSDVFDLKGYKGKVRVVKAIEKKIIKNKETKKEIRVVTNMLNHNVETVIKIMHYRWNIENCGFRTLKQRYNLRHIYIGDLNSINYMFQMSLLAFNLLELYMKIRLKERIKMTWSMITKTFETDFHNDITINAIFANSG